MRRRGRGEWARVTATALVAATTSIRRGERGGGSVVGVPKPSAEVEDVAVMGGKTGGVLATVDTTGHDAELGAKTAELLGKLRASERLSHVLREAIKEEIEVAGEDHGLSVAAEKALEEADLIRLRPDALELERRRMEGVGGRIIVGGIVGVGESGGRVRVRGRGRGRRGGGGERRGTTLDGEFTRGGGFEGVHHRVGSVVLDGERIWGWDCGRVGKGWELGLRRSG